MCADVTKYAWGELLNLTLNINCTFIKVECYLYMVGLNRKKNAKILGGIS